MVEQRVDGANWLGRGRVHAWPLFARWRAARRCLDALAEVALGGRTARARMSEIAACTRRRKLNAKCVPFGVAGGGPGRGLAVGLILALSRKGAWAGRAYRQAYWRQPGRHCRAAPPGRVLAVVAVGAMHRSIKSPGGHLTVRVGVGRDPSPTCPLAGVFIGTLGVLQVRRRQRGCGPAQSAQSAQPGAAAQRLDVRINFIAAHSRRT